MWTMARWPTSARGGPCRGGGAGWGARTTASETDHGQLVEGRARGAGLRGLQSERPPQDGVRRVVRPPEGRGAGLHPAGLGRGRHRRSGRGPDHPHGARPRPTTRRSLEDRSPTIAQSLQPLLEMVARDRANELHDAPWPPEYPKQPDEPRRVASARAKRESTRVGPGGGPLRRIAYLLERDGCGVIQGPSLPQRRASPSGSFGHRGPGRDASGQPPAGSPCREDQRPGDHRGTEGARTPGLSRGALESVEQPQISPPAAKLLGRLQGDCHSHSDWSDGGSPIHEMAEAARERRPPLLGAHRPQPTTDRGPRSRPRQRLRATARAGRGS